MPEEYFESTHFKLPALTGKNPIHDIGTGFKKLAEKLDEVLYGRAVLVEGGANFPNFMSWGSISLEGAILASSGDFTLSKIGTGEYEIKWAKAKTSANYCVVVCPNTEGSAAPKEPIGTGVYEQTTAIVKIFVNYKNVLERVPFAFVAFAAS